MRTTVVEAIPRSPAEVGLSVVVPVLDGAGFIARNLADLAAHLHDDHPDCEIVVVDDGSTDGTAAILAEAAAALSVPVRVVRHERTRGKGEAVRTGMQAARGRYRVFLDADLAYPPSELATVVASLAAGADVAIASRVHPESRYLVRPSFFRYLYTRHVSGRLFNWLVRLVLLPGIADTQAGLKGFRAAAADALFAGWMPHGFSFDLAVLARARRLGLRIDEVPVTFRYDREPTTMRFLADTLGMLRDVLVVRVRVGRGGVVSETPRAGDEEPGVAPPRSPAFPWPAFVTAALLLGGVEAARRVAADPILPLGLWLAAGGVWLAAARAHDRHAGVPRVRVLADRSEALLLLGIVALASVLRLAALSELPAFMHHDTASCGLVGRDLLTGAAKDPFELVERWYNVPYLGLVPHAVCLKLLGTNVLALRLTSAIPGILAVVALYFLVRGWFGRVAAGVAAVLLATNHVAVHFSRAGIWNIHALLLGIAALAALFAGWRRRSVFWLSAAGMCGGLSLYTYTAGRLFFGLTVLVVLALARHDRPRGRRPAAFFAVALGLTVAPLVATYARHPGVLADDRLRNVNPFSEDLREHVESQVGSFETGKVLDYQVRRTLGAFTHLGDTDSNYGTRRPLVSPVTTALALAGAAFALVRLPDRRYATLLVWLGSGLLFGGVLAVNPPSFPRLLAILPVPLVLAAMIVGRIWDQARALGPVIRSVTAVLVLVVAGASLAINAKGYLRFIARTDVDVDEWTVLEALQELRDARAVYLFTGAYMLGDSPVFELFRGTRRLVTGLDTTDLPDVLREPTAFVLIPSMRHIGTELTERFPDLERETRSSRGVWQLTVYRSWADPAEKGDPR